MTHATHMSFTMRCILVFSGGALGGIARVLIMHATDGSIAQLVMPALLLLAINLSGCLLAGIVRSSLERSRSRHSCPRGGCWLSVLQRRRRPAVRPA